MEISEIRQKIDETDRRIVELLNERAELAIEIGKKKAKKSSNVFVPEREQQVFSRVTKSNHGPLPSSAITAIFREIISASRALEKPISISYLGPPGSNTHIAVTQRFGSSIALSPAESITDVFHEVEQKKADFGVVPIENSTEGIVTHTLDMFLQSELFICSEIFVQISHNLLSAGRDISRVKRVYSMPQATAQCRGWLRANLPGVEIVEVSTTARAAIICKDDPDSAAVATKLAAHEYGLNILKENIEDSPYNRTRFLVIGYTEPPPTGKDKTSIVFSVPHKSGALYRSLQIFEQENINLTLIESRPTKQMPWEYVFFIDFQGHEADPHVRLALKTLTEESLFVRILGSYPEAE
ncbi:MAG: prephenate dehydratase [Armatimonadota bacterium]|nr:prephenate dehydratase [Armatimonadota bacterium]